MHNASCLTHSASLAKLTQSQPPQKMKGLYAGSFDPFTLGHLDVLQQATKVFSEIEVVVGINSEKQGLFSPEERVVLIQEATKHLPNITVNLFKGLLIDYAKATKATALIRGLRQVSDFDYELRMASANRRLCAEIPTVTFWASEAQLLTSSSIVREIHKWGGDTASFVPENVEKALGDKREV
jgi:pantetheine-phosphate adenylyltransferase